MLDQSYLLQASDQSEYQQMRTKQLLLIQAKNQMK